MPITSVADIKWTQNTLSAVRDRTAKYVALFTTIFSLAIIGVSRPAAASGAESASDVKGAAATSQFDAGGISVSPQLLGTADAAKVSTAEPPRAASAEILLGTATQKLPHTWEKVIGVGSAFLLTRADVQQHLKMAHDLCGFKYVRCHGIFCDDIEICNRDRRGNITYNWQTIDYVYDSLLKADMKPFVELSFMPTALASGRRTIFHYKGNITEPANYNQWRDFIQAFVTHMINHFGRDEVRQWYFEVWNEPNLDGFWTGTQADYFRFYRETALAVKSVDNALRVGGPATARGAWVEDFVNFCRRENVPFDFVSTHIYPDDENVFTLDRDYQTHFKGEGYLRDNVRYNYDLLARMKSDAEIHWTEWNSSWQPRRYEREDSNQAAFICRAVHETHACSNSFSYWTATDVFDEGGLPTEAFPGMYGLININGLPKAAFNGFRLLHWLGDEEVKVTGDGLDDRLNVWATHKGSTWQALAYYWQPPQVPELPPRTLNIILKQTDATPARMELDTYAVDRTHSNVYTAWKGIGSPACLTRRDVEFLSSKSGLEIIRRDALDFGKSPTATLSFSITPGTVLFLDLRERI